MRYQLSNLSRARAATRRGSMLVMIAVLMAVVMAMVAFAVDVSYMQLVRTELRAANDAATKAGTLALLQSNGDANAARAAAIAGAARNNVAGRPLVLSNSDIQVGHSTRQSNGTWLFTANQTPFTALRINGKIDQTTTSGAVPLFFGAFVGRTYFEPQQTAIASQLDQEICLAVDRSHSMCFDLSGVTWSYPPSIPAYPNGIKYKPHATSSRWAALASGVNLFVNTVSTRNNPPRVALVTWGSDIGRNTAEFQLTGKTEVAVCNETGLSSSYQPLVTKIQTRSNNVMLGGTDMSTGMDAACAVLNGSDVRPLAQRTMILMTDGQWNAGRDPVLAAQDAAAQGIVIHTIAFLQETDPTTMQQVATITGGRFYYASSQSELEAAFMELAVTLPIVLTQ